jgi:drug/metabolite transporter (DMT)-like permease
MTRAPWVEYLLLGLLATLWGSSYMLIRLGVETIPPVSLIALRVSVAAVVLTVVVIYRGQSLPKDVRTWGMVGVQSFFNSWGAWTILAWGQQYIQSGLAGVLNSTSPIFVFFLTLFISRHEKVSVLKLAGACLGVVGVTLIIGIDALDSLGNQVIAQLAVLFGAFLYGCAYIYGVRFQHLSPLVTAASVLVFSSLILVPASLIIDQPWTLRPSLISLASVVILGIFCTALALLLYFRLLRTLGSMGTSSQAYLRIGISVLLGVVILGETIPLVVGIGLILAIAGVILINTGGRKA